MSSPLICPRCVWPGPNGSATERTLEAHLVEAHFLSGVKARLEVQHATRLRVNGVIQAPTLPAAPLRMEEHHTCPRCQTVIDCDLASLFALEQQATRLRILAGMWRARLNGVKIGAPRRNAFDVETARRLVADGMSYQAVADALGASSSSAVKSELARIRRREQRTTQP